MPIKRPAQVKPAVSFIFRCLYQLHIKEACLKHVWNINFIHNANFIVRVQYYVYVLCSNSECDVPYYGQNCSKVCECGPGGNGCDPVHGCVCLSGWTGEKCDQDIDECYVNPFICGSERICQNLEGTFSCSCGEGFLTVGNKCEGIRKFYSFNFVNLQIVICF